MFCPNCGKEIQTDEVRCVHCVGASTGRTEALPAETSGMAIASLIFGVLSLVTSFLAGIPAIVLGIIALSQISRERGRVTGSGMATAGIILGVIGSFLIGIIAMLAAIAVPNFLEAQTRSQVSRARADLRSLATALEAYRIDTNAYPPDLFRLTTPVAYLTAVPRDPFPAPNRTIEVEVGSSSHRKIGQSAEYQYITDRDRNWVIFSAGPDRQYDIRGITGLFIDNQQGPPPALVWLSYDPTNGTVSRGDIWRTNQPWQDLRTR